MRAIGIVMLSLLAFVLAAGQGRCAEIAQSTDGALALESTGSPGCAGFCRMYESTRNAASQDEVAMLADIVWESDVAFAKRAWLIWSLVTVERKLGSLNGLIDGLRPFGMVIRYTAHLDFDAGIWAAARAETYDFISASLMISKSIANPLGVPRGDDSSDPFLVLRPGVMSSDGDFPEEADLPAGAGVDSSASAFCLLYGRAVSAKSDDERLKVAADLVPSAISLDEKAWIRFTLIAPGMDANAAERLAGAGRPPIATSEAVHEEVRSDARRKDRVVKVGKPLPLLRYDTGILLLVTEDAHPVVKDVFLYLRCRNK